LMEKAIKRDVVFAGAQGGGFIFPRFLPAYDGIFAFCKLLEYLSKAEIPLSSIVNKLPKVNLANRTVYCPWEKKGSLMRGLIEKHKGKEVVLIDGVKVFTDSSWVLVVPDPDEPVVRVYTEAKTQKIANKEVNEALKLINKIIED
ncbi:MAG: hypothetical protein KAS39_05330, partial [Actinomycetia bacterium]|nr:hypothetical protein [Actinomycetes bacterium]